MSANIIAKDCTKCGICKTHCHVNAIQMTADGQYKIDLSICDGCDGFPGIQCAMLCIPECIVDACTGEIIERGAPSVLRLRPATLLTLVAIMGAGNSGRYTGPKEFAIERNIIAQAIMNPAIEVRIIWESADTAERLGLTYNQAIVFWDAISRARQMITPEDLKALGKPDAFIEDFTHSISPYNILERGLPT